MIEALLAIAACTGIALIVGANLPDILRQRRRHARKYHPPIWVQPTAQMRRELPTVKYR